MGERGFQPLKRLEMVRLHIEEGLTPKEIATKLGTNPGNVRSQLSHARVRGEINKNNKRLSIVLSEKVVRLLDDAAAERKLPTTALIQRMLTYIAEEDMTNAVMDDQ